MRANFSPAMDENRRALNQVDNSNIVRFQGKVNNTYLQDHERGKLALMLAHGRIFYPKRPFADSRHKAIYLNLVDFLQTFPDHQINAGWFAYYLAENEQVQICGGKEYVMSIFRGIGDE